MITQVSLHWLVEFQSYTPLNSVNFPYWGGGGANTCRMYWEGLHSLWEMDRIHWFTTPVPNKLL